MSPNNLRKTKAYLAGHIQNTTGADSFKWREKVSKKLEGLGVICLNPRVNCFANQIAEDEATVNNLKSSAESGNYDTIHNIVKQIIRRDLRMVDVADFLIVDLDCERPTYGTVHEIIVASSQRKPILFRVDKKSAFPLWLFGLIDHRFIFETWDDLIAYLKFVNDSPVDQLDNKYWKIFSEDYR